MKFIFSIIFILAISNNVKSFVLKQNVQKWLFRYKALEIIERAGGNTECANHLKLLVSDLVKRQPWALKMADASAKPQPGILAGNLVHFGNFDECLDVHVELNKTNIDGQYCSVLLVPNSNFSSEFDFVFDSHVLFKKMGFKKTEGWRYLKLSYSVCIPKSCTIEHLQKMWDYIEYTMKIPVHASFKDVLCSYKDKQITPLSIDKYVYFGFGVILLIVVLSTLYDVLCYQSYMEDKVDEPILWTSFSIYTNFNKIFSYNTQSETSLASINGIKCLSMLWVITGHRYAFNLFYGNINGTYFFEWKQQLFCAFLTTGTFAVENFFIISGFLLSYGFAKYKESMPDKKISWLMFYLYRIMRIFPSIWALICIYLSVFKNLDNGPLWGLSVSKIIGSCARNWWPTMFSYSNWIGISQQCIEHSWFLSVDTQLYFLSPLLLTHLYTHPKKTAAICATLCLTSIVYSFTITYVNEYPTLFSEAADDYYIYVYQPTFVRMTPWMVGIFLGLFYYKYKDIKIPTGVNLLAWFLSLTFMAYMVKVYQIFNTTDYDAFTAALHNSCARPLWSIAMAYILFSCFTGHGGLVNKLLSFPVFGVFTKLSYSIFMIHIAVITYFIVRKKTNSYFDSISSVHHVLGDLLVIFFVATIWCMVFESPFVNIAKILTKKDGLRNKDKSLVSSKKRRLSEPKKNI